MPQHPLVSVVMPSYNQAAFLDEAIASVLEQDWTHVELIVADGGSTDGSLAILERWQRQDSRLRWHSEPDDGPAHALNKALGRVRGTLVGWLNSDDRYTPGAIGRAVNAMQDHSEWMLCYGEGEHVDAQGHGLGRYPTLPEPTDNEAGVPDKSAFQDGCFICQPTVFFKAVMVRLLGPLDQSLKTAFDFDYWLRAFNAFPGRVGYFPEVQAQSRLHDGCITQQQRRLVALEGMTVLARHQEQALGHWVMTYLEEQQRQEVILGSLEDDIFRLLTDVQPLTSTQEWQSLRTNVGYMLTNI